MAGFIQQQFIDQLLNRIDIVDVIDAKVPLKSAGRGEFKACCPFHDEKTPSFTVSSDKQFYHCFGCGAHGSAISFLMNYSHLNFVEAVEEIASYAGIEVEYENPSNNINSNKHPPRDQSLNMLALIDKINNHFINHLKADTSYAKSALSYLTDRGLTEKSIDKFELGLTLNQWDDLVKHYQHDNKILKMLEQAGLIVKRDNGGYYDRFRSRVMFPIRNYKGKIVAFGGRVLANDEPKYLNSPQTPVFNKGSELYNLYNARKAIGDIGHALIVEGYMDVIMLSEFAIDNAVATLGTATTRAQLERLFRYTNRVVFCFDGDTAGKRAAWRVLKNTLPLMEKGRMADFLFLPEGLDPDAYVRKQGKQAFDELTAKAMPLTDFLLVGLIKQTNLTTIEGRLRLLTLAKPYLTSLSDGILKQTIIMKIAERAQLNPGQVEVELSQSNNNVHSFRSKNTSTQSNEPLIDNKSVVARLLNLLINHPKLNEFTTDLSRFLQLDEPGIDLLVSLNKTISENSNITTGGIVEQYRNTKFNDLLELLAPQHHIELSWWQLEIEFKQLLNGLEIKAVDEKINMLMKSINTRQPTADEASTLKTLHNKRLKIRDNL